MKKVWKMATSLLCCLLFFSCQSQQESRIKRIDKTTLKGDAVGKNVQLIDVRTPAEYSKGHIDNAININVNDHFFQEQIMKLDKEQPVYVYCKKGARSGKAAKVLQRLGFETIYDYSGGYDDWIKTEK